VKNDKYNSWRHMATINISVSRKHPTYNILFSHDNPASNLFSLGGVADT